MRTVQTVVYYRDETPKRGCVVVIDRKKEGSEEREEVQRLTLLDWEAREAPHDMGLAFRLTWKSTCTECGGSFEVKTNNYTKALPRRCKPCRKANPYNAEGWQARPRNRYVRLDPETESAPPAPAVDADETWNALSSADRMALLRDAKAELSGSKDRNAVEALARAKLASLF